MKTINVIGAGLAGCEAANQIAKAGYKVVLHEMKPLKKSPAHESDNFAELVCSNSLKSNLVDTAGGLIKQELRLLDSLLIKTADNNAVDAGGALAVDRDKFSLAVTKAILANPNITIKNEIVSDINEKGEDIYVIACGPLCDSALIPTISRLSGDFCYFFDAVAPIVTHESIDFDSAFFGSRYGKGGDDYVNCPMNKAEFEKFWTELVNAETAVVKDFENNVFEGCMPIEVMAKRGMDTIRFGPLKPVGLYDQRSSERPYAVLQLRKENVESSIYNLVGFQTHLTWGEQKRVFSLIPALANAEFVRYGVMHKNTFINSPKVLNSAFQCKQYPNVFFAGQITGVEGYVESIASGLMAGLNVVNYLQNKQLTILPNETIIGSLANYISITNSNFQPMNANFGILSPLPTVIRDKKAKKAAYAERSLAAIERYLSQKE